MSATVMLVGSAIAIVLRIVASLFLPTITHGSILDTLREFCAAPLLCLPFFCASSYLLLYGCYVMLSEGLGEYFFHVLLVFTILLLLIVPCDVILICSCYHYISLVF